jgi:ABC-type nitrate/sulfonate/bicarbonate transport system substrate-binding protein
MAGAPSGRRGTAIAATAVLVLGLAIAATGTGARSATPTDHYVPAPPEAGTNIPEATVRFGMRPYADNTFYVVAMKKGWYKDVGISIAPKPYGLKVTDAVVTSLLLKQQLDISSEFGPLLLPVLKSENVLRLVGFVDTFQGWAVLANPKLKLKTVNDYMKQGMPFKQALKKALEPVSKSTLVVAPQISARPFVQIAFKLAGLPLPKFQVLDDSKSLVLAKAGRIQFATPEGAPITLTYENAGWAPLVSPIDILKNVKGGPTSEIEPLASTVGLAAHAEYVNTHQNTVLRFLSVVFRTIDAIQKDPKILSLQAPYLNSVAGTSLDYKGIQKTLAVLDPLSNFEAQKSYCRNPAGALFYRNAYTSFLKTLEDQKVLPAGKFKADDVIWACKTYDALVGYQQKTDALLKPLEGKSLSSAKKALVAKAKQFYGWYDFLDAYRFAKAAAA